MEAPGYENSLKEENYDGFFIAQHVTKQFEPALEVLDTVSFRAGCILAGAAYPPKRIEACGAYGFKRFRMGSGLVGDAADSMGDYRYAPAGAFPAD
jgi:hypothetical protein